MPLAAGTKLGPYEVIAPLGAGGMGEVYKARDTRLNRDVALKILPEAFAHDKHRRDRFETEAKAVAALNHPNIVALHDIGDNFTISELIDGETLRDAKLTQRKALEVAAQIADGLAAAHAKGITHRDLKPDNVMLTRDGRAKILDFGLAQRAPGTTDATVTAAGTVMGTASYMSPEQVRGENVDARSDIFSFGALVYELLAARRAFDGPTAVEAMNAILKDDPPELPEAVPAGVRELIRACLEKDKEQRFQSAKDLGVVLRALSGRAAATTSEVLPVQKPATKRAPLWIAAATLLIGAVGGAKLAQTANEGLEQTRVTLLTFGLASKFNPALSPDGQSVAYFQNYNGLTELAVQSPSAPQPVVLVRGNAFGTVGWTADGARICYHQWRDLWCVGSAGGTPQKVIEYIASAGFAPRSGDVYFIRREAGKSKLFVSSPFGAPPKPLEHVVVPDQVTGMRVAPNDSAILFATPSGGWLTPLQPGGTAQPLGESFWVQGWLPDSRHFIVAKRSLGRDGTRLLLADKQSDSQRLLHTSDGVVISFDVSRDGEKIAFSHGQPEWNLVEYSAAGKKLRALGAGFQGRWSPSGERVVYQSQAGAGRKTMTMQADGTGTALVSDRAGSGHYSPDGSRIAISSEGIYVVPSTGGREVKLQARNDLTLPICWSPDGEWIWFSENGKLQKVSSQGGAPVAVQDGSLLGCAPNGFVAYRTAKSWGIIGPDGKSTPWPVDAKGYSPGLGFSFGEGGRVAYATRADAMSIGVLDAKTGVERAEIKVELDPSDAIRSIALHPDGKRFLLTTGNLRYNISILEGFAQPETGWRSWFRHWRIPEAPPPEADVQE